MSGHTDNAITIEAPMDLVWSMTNDVASWPSLFSEYASAEVLSSTDDTVTFRLTLKPDENGTSWSWVSERTMDPHSRTTRSHRVETGPFKYMSLFWEYVPGDDGVTLRWVQDFEMKAVAPVSDAQMQQRLDTNTRVQMQLIKAKVEAAVAA